jgi:hypothetical protein
MAVGGTIGGWLSGSEGIGVGIVAGGFAYSCWDLGGTGSIAKGAEQFGQGAIFFAQLIDRG